MSLWEEPVRSVCQTPASSSLWLESKATRGAGALSLGLPIVKVLVTFKASHRNPHCQRRLF